MLTRIWIQLVRRNQVKMNIDREKVAEIFGQARDGAKTAWDNTPNLTKAFAVGFLASFLATAAWNYGDNEIEIDVTENKSPCVMLQEAVNELHDDSQWDGQPVTGTLKVGDNPLCDISIAPK